jgi:D-cysteine desulfhydrase
VERAAELGAAVGYADLWIKRDDVSAQPYGGNKPRKLEFLLAKALAAGDGAVVTMGGIGTNHGLATAAYAQQAGLACHLVLFDQPVTDYVKKNIRLFHHFGAQCHYAGGYATTAWMVAKELVSSRIGEGAPTALIPAGGTNALGTLGFVDAALELADQVRAGVMPEPRFIFCAAGSCGTYAGLSAGIKLAGLRTRVVGVRVVDRVVVNRRNILRAANGALGLLRDAGVASVASVSVESSDITLVHSQFGGEYGRVTPEGREAVALCARHGIAIETTYTGKTFAGMREFLSGHSARLGPALFWNTYNSHDLSAEAAAVPDEAVAPELRRFLHEPAQA